MSILIFLIILLVLVLSHEFGHFIVAKKTGMRVDEFSFGFPPKLFGKKVGETTYNFNALPFGGYVKIHGEDPDEDTSNDADASRNFTNKPWYSKIAVLIAGVTMNFLLAWILLSIGFVSGLPTSTGSAPKNATVKNEAITIVNVLSNSAAEESGVKVGDKIISLETSSDSTLLLSSNFTIESVQEFIKKHNKENIDFNLQRGKESLTLSVTPKENSDSPEPIVGISMDMIGNLNLPIHLAVWEGLKLSTNLTGSIAFGFYHLIGDALVGKGNLSSVTGPIGIVSVVGDAASFGFIYLLSFTAFISLNLVVINAIPFPALDGGRILFLLIEKIKGSRIKPKVVNFINLIGFGLLMLFMVVITYHDILKLL